MPTGTYKYLLLILTILIHLTHTDTYMFTNIISTISKQSLTFQAESLIANETSTDLVEWQQAGRTSAALDHLVADAVLDSMKRNTASFDSKGVHAATKKSSN